MGSGRQCDGTRPCHRRHCPPTAQYALRQGRRLADNIAAVLQGESPQPFRFQALGLLAGLGRRSAVAEIFGLRFSGFIAWWLWRTIYLMKLPGFERSSAWPSIGPSTYSFRATSSICARSTAAPAPGGGFAPCTH